MKRKGKEGGIFQAERRGAYFRGEEGGIQYMYIFGAEKVRAQLRGRRGDHISGRKKGGIVPG